MAPPDLANLSSPELIEILRTCGYDVPPGVPEEIVRRAGETHAALCALARDDALWDAKEPAGYMAPFHAIHLLGAIGDAAAPLLVEVLVKRDLGDIQTESAPAILAALGLGAIDTLMDASSNAALDTYVRNALARGLYGIAAKHPNR